MLRPLPESGRAPLLALAEFLWRGFERCSSNLINRNGRSKVRPSPALQGLFLLAQLELLFAMGRPLVWRAHRALQALSAAQMDVPAQVLLHGQRACHPHSAGPLLLLDDPLIEHIQILHPLLLLGAA